MTIRMNPRKKVTKLRAARFIDLFYCNKVTLLIPLCFSWIVCQEDLIDLNEDIELKSKLIEQLEMTKNRMEKMRQIYEDKLNVLNSKIINTQRERDQVLANMTASMGGNMNLPVNNDKTKKVREEYERKISEMQKELKKLQLAQREHARQQREIHAQESQLRTLKAELSELKSTKVSLLSVFQ